MQLHYGFGRPQYYLTERHLIEMHKYAYGEWIQTFATLMWTKVSICLFLRRIPATKLLIKPLEVSVAFLILSNVIITILWIVQCRPVDAAWNSNIQGSCFSRGQLERIIIAQASESTWDATALLSLRCPKVISAVSDFAFAAYPILILWKIQMNLNTKIGLCCLMGLGVLYVAPSPENFPVSHADSSSLRTGACCIVRTVLNYQSLPTDTTCMSSLDQKPPPRPIALQR